MKLSPVTFALSFCILTLSSQYAYAKIYHYTLLELVESADYIVTGKITRVGDTTAIVKLDKVLKGSIPGKEIKVTGIYYQHCTGQSKNFKEGEDALLFLSAPEKGMYKVICGGQGKITLHKGVTKHYRPAIYASSAIRYAGNMSLVQEYDSEDTIQSIRRLIDVSSISDQEEKTRVLFELCESPNPILRVAAWTYVQRIFFRTPRSDRLKKNITKMLKSRYPDTRAAGVSMLQCFEDPDSAGLILEAAKDPDYSVVASAVYALYRIDRPKAMEILVGLDRHKDPLVRIFACQELYRNKHPGLKEACRKLLDDKDEKVLIAAAKALTLCGIRGKAAAEVIYPRLIEMLDNSSDELLIAALFGLSASREPEMIRPLMRFLVKDDATEKHKGKAVQAIHGVLYETKSEYFTDHPELKQFLFDNLHLVINHLDNGGLNPHCAIYILQKVGTPEAIDAMKRAAKEHPHESVRKTADGHLRVKERSIARVTGGCAFGNSSKAALLIPLALLFFFVFLRRKLSTTRPQKPPANVAKPTDND